LLPYSDDEKIVNPSYQDGVDRFVLRNPFDRLISAFFSPHRVAQRLAVQFDREEFKSIVGSQRTLRDFICLSDRGSLLADINFLMRFEALQCDFDKVCATLGLPRLELPHRNKRSQPNGGALNCGIAESGPGAAARHFPSVLNKLAIVYSP